MAPKGGESQENTGSHSLPKKRLSVNDDENQGHVGKPEL